MAADQLKPAVSNAGGRSVVPGQSPLALEPPNVAIVIIAVVIAPRVSRLCKLGNLDHSPQANVAVRSAAEDKRGACVKGHGRTWVN